MTSQPSLEEQWRRKLLDEGFDHVFTWQGGAHVTYTDHAHPFVSAYIILEGEMTIVTEEQGKVLKQGDRIDVRQGVLHSSKIGPSGCRYIIGQKYGI